MLHVHFAALDKVTGSAAKLNAVQSGNGVFIGVLTLKIVEKGCDWSFMTEFHVLESGS